MVLFPCGLAATLAVLALPVYGDVESATSSQSIPLGSAPKAPLPRTCAWNSTAVTEAWCDTTATFETRAAALVANLTLKEKSQLFNVVMMLGYLEKNNLKGTHWDSTCIHGVSNAGNATVFPHAINLAASFDLGLVSRIGLATAAEMRSISTADYVHGGGKSYNDVCDGGPLANTAHDPRWGRISETYGEDPFLVQQIGVAAMLSLQNRTAGGKGTSGQDFLSVPQVVRHFIGYHGAHPDLPKPFMNVSTRDLYDAYLPNYEALIKTGQAEGVMCGYAELNGVPSCQDPLLMKTMLREQWNSTALIQTDCCDSMFDWVGPPGKGGYYPTRVDAFIAAVDNGVQLYYGYAPQDTVAYWNQTILDNYTLKEAQLDAAAERVLLTRFRAGEFDEHHPFRALDVAEGVVNSPAHRALAREAAAKSSVLLVNPPGKGGVPMLPLALGKGKKVLVTGPFAHATEIKAARGYGDNNAYAHSYSGIPSQVVTPYEALQTAAADMADILYSKGSNETTTNDTMIAAAVHTAIDAEVVVLCVGSGSQIEAEGRDRVNLTLPPAQQRLVEAVRQATAKSSTFLVIVLFTAGGIPLTTLPGESLLYVGYPGQEAGSGVVDVLVGTVNPSARMPLTTYPTEYLPKLNRTIADFDVSAGVGRTYRYLDEKEIKPVYRFGFGLSYSRFGYSELKVAAPSQGSVTATVTVTNSGDRDGDEVVQAYVSLPAQPGKQLMPISSLCAFDKVSIKKGAATTVTLTCDGYALMAVDADGTRTPATGTATIHVGGFSPGGAAATTEIVSGTVALR